MSFLISLLTFIGVLVLAARGRGYRALYFALCLCAFVLGVVTIGLQPSDQQLAAALASGDEAQARGTQVLYDYGTGVAVWFLAAAFAGVLGGLVYRRPATQNSQAVTS
jgi:hypothetical protein